MHILILGAAGLPQPVVATLEELDEERILAIDRKGDVANCSVTMFARGTDPQGRSKLELERYNFVAPLQEAGQPVTTEPDRAVTP